MDFTRDNESFLIGICKRRQIVCNGDAHKTANIRNGDLTKYGILFVMRISQKNENIRNGVSQKSAFFCH